VSEENLEIVRRLAAAFNARDVEAFVSDLDPEAEIHSIRAQLEGRPYEGHEGARRMFADFEEDWEYVQVEIDDLRDAGDTIVAVGQLRSRGRASRVDLDVAIGFLWRLRNGKVVYARVFSEPSDALREAGLD
jgi:ketosteroid isomerase-like protein